MKSDTPIDEFKVSIKLAKRHRHTRIALKDCISKDMQRAYSENLLLEYLGYGQTFAIPVLACQNRQVLAAK
jgi:hypothetical protein